MSVVSGLRSNRRSRQQAGQVVTGRLYLEFYGVFERAGDAREDFWKAVHILILRMTTWRQVLFYSGELGWDMGLATHTDSNGVFCMVCKRASRKCELLLIAMQARCCGLLIEAPNNDMSENAGFPEQELERGPLG